MVFLNIVGMCTVLMVGSRVGLAFIMRGLLYGPIVLLISLFKGKQESAYPVCVYSVKQSERFEQS